MKSKLPLFWFLLFPIVAPASILPTFEELVDGASWVVIGKFEIKDSRVIEFRSENDEIIATTKLIHGTVYPDSVIIRYSQHYLRYEGIPENFDVAVFSNEVDRLPEGESTLWILRPHNFFFPYQLVWPNPEDYKESRKILDDFFGSEHRKLEPGDAGNGVKPRREDR